MTRTEENKKSGDKKSGAVRLEAEMDEGRTKPQTITKSRRHSQSNPRGELDEVGSLTTRNEPGNQSAADV